MKPLPTPRHSSPQTRVLCVDDSDDMTLMMRMLIDADPSMQCIGCLDSADHLLNEIARLALPPDVVILDATMPGKDPLKVLPLIASRFPAIKTIIYSAHDDIAFVKHVRDLGARGCVSKREEPDAILHAIREIAAGNCWFPPS